MSKEFLFTSESVSEGHPDKVCDRISDAILDAYLAQDPYAKVACETLVSENLVVIAGETHSTARVDAEAVAREAIRSIGYTDEIAGFCDRSPIQVHLHAQSADILRGVDRSDGQVGAGDQGLMFGYAVDETPELMPLPIMLAHRLMQRQALLRKGRELPWLRPDAKSQVTVRYRDGRPVGVETVVLSTQHAAGVPRAVLEEGVVEEIIKKVIPAELRGRNIRYLVNPTGSFVIGGPAGDTGLTGRKIIVDTYGGSCPHGGGAFSGKDPTKVDRSGAYAARYVAKNVVAAGIARKCTVQISYAIGVAEPVSLLVETEQKAGAAAVDAVALEKAVRSTFDLTPGGIIRSLDLRKPVYSATSAYGHFGREGFSWERTDRSAEVTQYLRSR